MWKGIISAEKGWFKLPKDIWSFLGKCGFTHSEMHVVLFFFIKLSESNDTVIYLTSQEAMKYASVNRRVFYYARDKMVSKGLVKKDPHVYDMGPFLEQLRKRGEFYKEEQ